MKVEWNKVTWYSKLAAIILFVFILPMLFFYIGTRYQKVVDIYQSLNVQMYQGK